MPELDKVPLSELEKELNRRQQRAEKLRVERDRLAEQLAAIEKEIAEISGAAPSAAAASAEGWKPVKTKAKKPAKKTAKKTPKKAAQQEPAAATPSAPHEAKAAAPAEATQAEPAQAEKPKPGKRGRKPQLPGAILGVLADAPKPLNAQEIADELQARNFPTKSKNLKSLVQEAVTRIKGIKRVKRGLYTAKKQ